MDILERRIREVFATLLAKGAKALERTAGELERASSQMRETPERRRDEAERVWSEEPPRRDPDTMIRSAPLRAVPDTPTDEAVDDTVWTPPDETPATPAGDRPGDVDAAATTSTTVADALTDDRAGTDRLEELSAGTVTQIRPQLGELSPDELRRLREIEAANRNRTTLIAAIDRTLADA